MNTQPGASSAIFDLDEERRILGYRGYKFQYGSESLAGGLFKPHVVLLDGPPGVDHAVLPVDTEEIAYSTDAEAERHAQQQAIRWINDRTGHSTSN